MRTEETKAMTHMRTQDGASASPLKGKTVLFTGASRGMGRRSTREQRWKHHPFLFVTCSM